MVIAHRTAPALLAGLLAAGLMVPGAEASPSAPPSPKPWVQEKIDQGHALANREVAPGSKEEDAWKSEARAMIDEVLDWNELTQQSLGSNWKKLTPAQQKEFAALLREMIEASYQSKIRLASRGDVKKPKAVKIDWLEEKVEGQKASLSAKVKADKNNAVLGFELLWNGAEWRVWDLAIDEVSTVRTYRSQFRKLIDEQGFQALLDRMKSKIGDIREGRAELAP